MKISTIILCICMFFTSFQVYGVIEKDRIYGMVSGYKNVVTIDKRLNVENISVEVVGALTMLANETIEVAVKFDILEPVKQKYYLIGNNNKYLIGLGLLQTNNNAINLIVIDKITNYTRTFTISKDLTSVIEYGRLELVKNDP